MAVMKASPGIIDWTNLSLRTCSWGIVAQASLKYLVTRSLDNIELQRSSSRRWPELSTPPTIVLKSYPKVQDYFQYNLLVSPVHPYSKEIVDWEIRDVVFRCKIHCSLWFLEIRGSVNIPGVYFYFSKNSDRKDSLNISVLSTDTPCLLWCTFLVSFHHTSLKIGFRLGNWEILH